MKKTSKRRILFALRVAAMVGAAYFAVNGISETLGQEKEIDLQVQIKETEVAQAVTPNVIPTEMQPTETNEVTEEDKLIAGIPLKEEEAYLLCKIAMAEAESEGVEGKALVMLVVLNRVESDEFPDNIRDVIFQKNQFSPIANGIYDRVEPDVECYEALEMIQSQDWDESHGALYFESQSNSKWHSDNLEFLFQYRNHYFYK